MLASSATASRSGKEMTFAQGSSQGTTKLGNWNFRRPRVLIEQLLDKSIPNDKVVSVRTVQGAIGDQDSIASTSDELPPWQTWALEAWTQGPEEAYACVIAMLLFRCSQLRTLSIWTPIASKALAFGLLFHERTVISSLHRLTLTSHLDEIDSLSGACTLFQIPSLRWLRATECQQIQALELLPGSVHVTKISLQHCLLSSDALRSLVRACTSITSFRYLASSGDFRTSPKRSAFTPVTSEEVVEILASQKDYLCELSLRIEPSVRVIDLETFIKSLAVFDRLEILGLSLVYLGLPTEGGRFKWEGLSSCLSRLELPSLTELIIYDNESDPEAWPTEEIFKQAFASQECLRSILFQYDDGDSSVTFMHFRPDTFGGVGGHVDTGGMSQPDVRRYLEWESSSDDGEADEGSVFYYPNGDDELPISWKEDV